MGRLGPPQRDPGFEVGEFDLEGGERPPFAGRQFGAVVVTNYLHRPIIPDLVAGVDPGGVLIYETYARGHEHVGRPRRPEFLLEPGELLDAVGGSLEVVAYENLFVDGLHPAVRQRSAAVRMGGQEPAGAGGDPIARHLTVGCAGHTESGP